MIRTALAASAMAAALCAVPAAAQTAAEPVAAFTGTRLDVVATAEVRRPPDLVVVNAGVSVQAPTAAEAIRQNAQRVAAMRAALTRAGIAERDLQTSNINLNPEYRHDQQGQATFIGYRANNEISVRFRDIANAGRILDALVSAGANTINGPVFSIDNPQPALDEARTRAVAVARTRADLYARTLGMRVKRILAVSEAGGSPVYGRMANASLRVQAVSEASSDIVPGEQVLSATISVSFELE